jgi:hypothetical protein
VEHVDVALYYCVAYVFREFLGSAFWENLLQLSVQSVLGLVWTPGGARRAAEVSKVCFHKCIFQKLLGSIGYLLGQYINFRKKLRVPPALALGQ